MSTNTQGRGGQKKSAFSKKEMHGLRAVSFPSSRCRLMHPLDGRARVRGRSFLLNEGACYLLDSPQTLDDRHNNGAEGLERRDPVGWFVLSTGLENFKHSIDQRVISEERRKDKTRSVYDALLCSATRHLFRHHQGTGKRSSADAATQERKKDKSLAVSNVYARVPLKRRHAPWNKPSPSSRPRSSEILVEDSTDENTHAQLRFPPA